LWLSHQYHPSFKEWDEHHWKVWQFKDMQLSDYQSRTFQSSEITLVPSRAPTTTEKMSEALVRGPQYPVKIDGARGFYGV